MSPYPTRSPVRRRRCRRPTRTRPSLFALIGVVVLVALVRLVLVGLRRSTVAAAFVHLGAKALRLLLKILQTADEEERLLGEMVEITLAQLVECFDGLLQRNRRARLTGELLGRHHVLRQEALDATGSLHQLLVLLGKLVDA